MRVQTAAKNCEGLFVVTPVSLKLEPIPQFLLLFKIQRPSEQLKAEKVAVNTNIVSRNGNKSSCLITKIIGNFRE